MVRLGSERAAVKAHFFPLHDLTHYAVETVLGFRRGFYGLVANGWDFADSARRELPDDAGSAELVASLLLDGEGPGSSLRDAERADKQDPESGSTTYLYQHHNEA
jgi:hypothetical protein